MIIVDAFNYILSKHKHATPKEIFDLSKKAIKILERHHKRFIFVFDGELEGHRSGNYIKWVGKGMKADDWIIEYLKEHKNETIVLVTRDKALSSKAKNIHPNVKVWDPDDLDRYLDELSAPKPTVESKPSINTLKEEKEMTENFNINRFEEEFSAYENRPKKRRKSQKERDLPTDFDYEKFSKMYDERIQGL